MIEIKNLMKSFGSFNVLNNVNLTIEEGSIMGLVGINGAGKSTLLRTITGILKKDAGSILIDGEEVYENENAKRKIFLLPDEPFFGMNQTPISLIDFYKIFYNFDQALYLEYLEHYDIPIKKPIITYSKGMKRQVFIALALAIKPKYLFLDEAFDGLDPLSRLFFKKEIMKLVEEENITVLISSHSLKELEEFCDSYALLDDKHIVSMGAINEDVNKYHKYQIAFNEEISVQDIPFEMVSYVQTKRIIKLITLSDLKTVEEKLKPLNPILIDEIAIDFEELFIIEVEKRGFLKWEDF